MFSIILDWVKIVQIISRDIRSILLSEFSLWIMIALVFSWPIWIQIYADPKKFFDVARDYNLELSFGVIIAIFPLAFYQVFGATPFNHIKNRKNKLSYNINSSGDVLVKSTSLKELKAIDFIHNAYIESSDLASKLYKRAGIYLVFGVVIAIGGLVFFSLQDFKIAETDNFSSLSIKVLPYAGILFFIEFIAFFFLRQYRQAMHEFRYFESIKRTRESQIFTYLAVPEDYKKDKPSEFISCLNLYNQHGVLSEGQRSEMLEAEKSNKNELDLISDFVNKVKTKSS